METEALNSQRTSVPAPGAAERWMIPGALAATLLACSPMLVYPMGPDQAFYAVGGWIVGDGGVPGVDFWGQAPPGALGLHALAQALFGRTQGAIRILDLLWSMATAVSLALLTRRFLGPGAGLVAACIWAWSYGSRYDFWHSAQVDGFLTLPAIGVLALAHRGCRDRRPGLWFGVGALVSLAFVVKYVALVLLLPLAAALWVSRGPRGIGREVVRPLLFTGAGFAAGLAPWLLWLGGSGALASLLADQGGANVGYATLALFGAGGEIPWRGLSRLAVQHAVLCALGGLGLFWIRRLEPVARALTIGWLVAAALSYGVQMKAFFYHSLPLLGPLALLGAHGLLCVLPRLPRVFSGLALTVLLATQVPALGQWLGQFADLARVATTETSAEDLWRARAGWAGRWELMDRVRARTKEGDTLYVWGYQPLFHFVTQRRSPTRFYTNAPMVARWAKPAWRQELLSDLRAHPPAFIVVCHLEANPWVTGFDLDSAALLHRFPELLALIEGEYRLSWRRPLFSLYRHRGMAAD